MPLPFEFVIDGPPVSQQARRRERVHAWKREVREAAERDWPSGELPVTEPVMLTITYFYEESAMDVDNIPKPIADALKGLVYVDDSHRSYAVGLKSAIPAQKRRTGDLLCAQKTASSGHSGLSAISTA